MHINPQRYKNGDTSLCIKKYLIYRITTKGVKI